MVKVSARVAFSCPLTAFISNSNGIEWIETVLKRYL